MDIWIWIAGIAGALTSVALHFYYRQRHAQMLRRWGRLEQERIDDINQQLNGGRDG